MALHDRYLDGLMLRKRSQRVRGLADFSEKKWNDGDDEIGVRDGRRIPPMRRKMSLQHQVQLRRRSVDGRDDGYENSCLGLKEMGLEDCFPRAVKVSAQLGARGCWYWILPEQ